MKIAKAPKASKINSVMVGLSLCAKQPHRVTQVFAPLLGPQLAPTRAVHSWFCFVIVGAVLLVHGANVQAQVGSATPAAGGFLPQVLPTEAAPQAGGILQELWRLPPPILRNKSRWVPVRWSELPGFADDALFEAWNAWVKSCERPPSEFAGLCPQIRRMSIASLGEQVGWMMEKLQPYRVETMTGEAQGLLTGYFEPLLEGSRKPTAQFSVPLHRPPASMAKKPWFSREEIDTLPAAQAQLQGRAIAFIEDPVDALLLQIQGSGRIRLRATDGSPQGVIRLAFAATNEQPYKSVGRWLLDQGALRDASWPAIKAWTQANPAKVQNMLWSNPRVVFFREEATDADPGAGPRGAQGVPLTAGRSIAVDPGSIPYGTPVWLATSGPTVNLSRLVLAQDTGSAIQGAVRADYFVGPGDDAGELAGRLKQPLQLWVLWPR